MPTSLLHDFIIISGSGELISFLPKESSPEHYRRLGVRASRTKLMDLCRTRVNRCGAQEVFIQLYAGGVHTTLRRRCSYNSTQEVFIQLYASGVEALDTISQVQT